MEHYGYVRSGQIHFLPGAGDNEASYCVYSTKIKKMTLDCVALCPWMTYNKAVQRIHLLQ